MARLSVNLNKVALLRNSRRTGVPDVRKFARIVHEAGAHGVTVHPRPDERHIRKSDVTEIAEVIAAWRPAFEYNIEGYPDDRLMEIVGSVRPEQCTLVPDAPGAFTSEEGWKLSEADRRLLAPYLEKLRALGTRIILFVDPDPDIVSRIKEVDVDGIEIYTGGYAEAFRLGEKEPLLSRCAETARRAKELGLTVNIGHDLNLENLPPLVAKMPGLHEASIGHELTADALERGFPAVIGEYRRALAGE